MVHGLRHSKVHVIPEPLDVVKSDFLIWSVHGCFFVYLPAEQIVTFEVGAFGRIGTRLQLHLASRMLTVRGYHTIFVRSIEEETSLLTMWSNIQWNATFTKKIVNRTSDHSDPPQSNIHIKNPAWRTWTDQGIF